MDSYIYGFGRQQFNMAADGDIAPEEIERRRSCGRSPPTNTRTSGRWSSTTPWKAGYDDSADFEFGLDLILEGLQRLLKAAVASGLGGIMSNGLKAVVFPTSDLAKSKELLSLVLGVAPVFDEPYYVGFQVKGLDIGLDPNGESRGMTGATPMFEVDDIRATVARYGRGRVHDRGGCRAGGRRPFHRHAARCRRQHDRSGSDAVRFHRLSSPLS